jgi:hypothetical protein
MEDFQDYLVELGISDRVIPDWLCVRQRMIWLYRNRYANLYLRTGLVASAEGMQSAPTRHEFNINVEVAGDGYYA